METDIIEKMRDLHLQATTEKTHFYVGAVLKEAMEEIIALRKALRRIP